MYNITTTLKHLQPIIQAKTERTTMQVNREHMFDIPRPNPAIGSLQSMDKDINDMYYLALRLFWIDTEVNISSKDTFDFNELPDGIKRSIRIIVTFFSAGDGWIMDANSDQGNTGMVGQVDIDNFIAVKVLIERIHAKTYKRILDATPGATDSLNEIARIPGLRNMKSFLDNVGHYVDLELNQRLPQTGISSTEKVDNKPPSNINTDILRRDLTYSAGLIAEACFEGIFFISSFVFIYWFAEKGKIPGLVAANELIGRDESMHTKGGCLIYSKLRNEYKLSDVVLRKMIGDAVELIDEFNTHLIGEGQPGLTIGMMRDYIKICANVICKLIGLGLMYDVKQPFPFMEKQNVENRTDFFVRKPTEYARPTLDTKNDLIDASNALNADDDF